MEATDASRLVYVVVVLYQEYSLTRYHDAGHVCLAADQTCRCTDDASPPETSRASAELRLLILANTRLRPPKLRPARLPRSAMLPERSSARDRAGVAPRLFARSTSDTCGQGRPSSRKLDARKASWTGRLPVAPREARLCQVLVESAGDELLRRWGRGLWVEGLLGTGVKIDAPAA